MDVTLLGTLGWMPRGARETTCFAVRSGASLLLFDAGTGLRRLLDPEHAGLLEGAEEVHLFLSHYHLDHVCGLAYLSGVLAGHEVVIHPPAETLTGVDPLAAVAELVRRPYNPVDLADMNGVRVQPGSRRRERGRRSRRPPAAAAPHATPACRSGWTTSSSSPPTRPRTRMRCAFAEGAGLWLHEAWYWAGDPALAAVPEELRPGYAAHSEATAVAGLAAQAGVGRLILVHLNPLAGESSYLPMRDAARAVFAHTDVVEDGTVAPHIGSRLTRPPAPREDASVARA